MVLLILLLWYVTIQIHLYLVCMCYALIFSSYSNNHVCLQWLYMRMGAYSIAV